jgi:putative redox protein
MVEMSAVYTGNLRCEIVHGPSKTVIETDPPVDNGGSGAKFSPTDLLGASLVGCILSTMAIMLKNNGINVDIKGARARVTKEMQASPRRVKSLPVEVTMPAGIPQEHRRRLEAAANGCPVHHSLHPEIHAPITIVYPD